MIPLSEHFQNHRDGETDQGSPAWGAAGEGSDVTFTRAAQAAGGPQSHSTSVSVSWR